MGIKTSNNEKWGMGLLLVFFSDDSSEPTIFNSNKPSSSKKHHSSSSSSSNLILTKTQSTISICALLVFITLLLFTLSSFEPTISHQILPPRRILKSYPQKFVENPDKKSVSGTKTRSLFSNWVSGIWSDKILQRPNKNGKKSSSDSHALQGMGKLFLRGTKAMNDLIVVHVMNDDDDKDDNRSGLINGIRMFLRLLHRSGLTSRADTVFIFGSKTESSVFNEVIESENESFLQLVRGYRETNQSGEAASFDVTQFLKTVKDNGESIWGKKARGNFSYSNSNNITNSNSVLGTEFARYGSVVGFDTSELDPENALAGFFDHVPVNLRRWSCYPMLLGRVRRNYKHIMLLDTEKILLLGDPLRRVRTQSSESVFLYTNPSTNSKNARKNSDKSPQGNPAVIMGGSRGVRRLSNFMLTEIVRAAMQQHKGKHAISESGILNQLVHNEFILKDKVNLIISTESIPDSNSLVEWTRNSGSKHTLVQRGINDVNIVIKKHICSFKVESSVYRDCGELETSTKVTSTSL